MPEQQTTSSILASYQSLPAHIRDWASSEQTTFSISEINNRLGLKNEKRKIIPRLILRLTTQDLDPLNFINELSHELGVSFQTAKSISQDIEEKVLKPIENELRRDVGVDVKLIYFGQLGPRPAAAPTIPVKPITPTPAATVPPAPAPAPIPAPQITPVAPQPEMPQLAKPPKEPTVSLKSFEVKEEEAPFILHQEHPNSAPPPSASETRTRPYEQLKIKPELNIKIKDYYQNDADLRGSTRGSTQKPISVRVETPSFDKAQDKQQKLRIVHYHGLRTPINNAGQPTKTPDENTIDLRKFFKK